MRIKLIAFALIGAAFSHSQQTHDPRFRTYGDYNYGGYDFPFRSGGSGPTDNADIIVVGALDGGTVGPFADKSSASDIALNWIMLREKRPRDGLFDMAGTYVYETTLEAAGFEYLYKMDILKKQIADESPRIEGYISKYLITHPNATDIVFEIANEPNAFPAMSPKLFAWYYLSWRQIVKGVVNAFNTKRANAWAADQNPDKGPAPLAVNAKFMPGGLWVFEGMPQPLLKMMEEGFSAYILGTHFSAKGYPNTFKYYQDFLNAMREPLYCDWPLVALNPQNTANVGVECGDYNLGNVTDFKYKPIVDARGRTLDLTTYVGNTPYYMDLESSSPVPVTSLIDIANLHFYPYIGYGSTMSLTAQFEFWKSLATLAADNTSSGEVWVTELGNINPFKDAEASQKMARPVLNFLQTDQIPQIKNWYWFRSKGEDSKFEEIGDYNQDPQKIALGILGGTYLFNSAFWPLLTFVDPPLSYSERSELLHWANVMAANLPDQGLSDKDGKVRRLGLVYNNLSTAIGNYATPPPPAVNLSITKWDYREMGTSFPPWKSYATLRWEWDRPDKGYDALFTVYVNTSPTPSSGSGIAELVGSAVCKLNPAGSSHRYSCAYDIPSFPFGSTIYVQLKGDDFLNTSLSSVLAVPHPVPAAPKDVFCNSDLTLPLNIPAPFKVDASDIPWSYDVNRQPLSFSNALQSNSNGGVWYYTTTATAPDFNLAGAAPAISTDPGRIADLDFSKPAVKVYPDGACIAASANGTADFTIPSPPSGLNASHYIFAHPPAMGFFTLTFQSGSTTRSTIPGLEEANPLPYAGIVYLGDFMQPGETVKSIRWKPAAAWNNTDPNVSPVLFKSISLSARNPYAPKLSPFLSSAGTQVVGGETLPVFIASPGENLHISANIQSGAGSYTASLDAGSAGKGMTVSTDGRSLQWTPSAARLGQHVVALTLNLSNLGYPTHKAPPNSQKLVIQVVQPEILSVPKSVGTFGQILEIAGKGFNTSAQLTKVSLDGAPLTPLQLDEASVSFVIPDNTAVGRLPVFLSSGTVNSNTVYVDVIPNLITLADKDGFVADRITPGGTYQAFGAGFGNQAAAAEVKVNGRTCRILEISDTRIKFILPPMAGGSAQVQVFRNGMGSATFVTKIGLSLASILSLLLD